MNFFIRENQNIEVVKQDKLKLMKMKRSDENTRSYQKKEKYR
jgi:hypothetical protein